MPAYAQVARWRCDEGGENDNALIRPVVHNPAAEQVCASRLMRNKIGAWLCGALGYCGLRRADVVMLEPSADVPNADHADQGVIVDDRHVPDVVLVHEIPDMFDCVGRAARN